VTFSVDKLALFDRRRRIRRFRAGIAPIEAPQLSELRTARTPA
jgi:hypothetical protein